MMNILILGGTGAMGKPLVDILLRNPEVQITVTSRSERKSNSNRLRYIVGNARDNNLLDYILNECRYDVIIDFMNYDLEEFDNRLILLLNSTDHYIWFSSCRVYAESSDRLTEKSPRLLETSSDQEFLSTNRYALRKARQENLLKNSGKNNYTIIRPYITYNTDRLQLGVLEKEHWLYRLLNGKSLVISETMLNKETTLTYGNDVSESIAGIAFKKKPHGEVYQIAGTETMKWVDILALYCQILKGEAGISPIIYSSSSIRAIEMLWEGGYNTIYDRNYNRKFDSSKLAESLGKQVHYTSMRNGLSLCLIEFLKSDRNFLHIDPVYEAYQDLLCNEISDSDYFDTMLDFEIYAKTRACNIDSIDGLENIKTRIV